MGDRPGACLMDMTRCRRRRAGSDVSRLPSSYCQGSSVTESPSSPGQNSTLLPYPVSSTGLSHPLVPLQADPAV